MQDQYDKWIARLETECLTTADASKEQDVELLAISSIAVSLKRIADTLDSGVGTFDGNGNPKGSGWC